jgi:hypothetical protein
LLTTLTLQKAMAAPASIGLSRSNAASGMPTTLQARAQNRFAGWQDQAARTTRSVEAGGSAATMRGRHTDHRPCPCPPRPSDSTAGWAGWSVPRC